MRQYIVADSSAGSNLVFRMNNSSHESGDRERTNVLSAAL